MRVLDLARADTRDIEVVYACPVAGQGLVLRGFRAWDLQWAEGLVVEAVYVCPDADEGPERLNVLLAPACVQRRVACHGLGFRFQVFGFVVEESLQGLGFGVWSEGLKVEGME